MIALVVVTVTNTVTEGKKGKKKEERRVCVFGLGVEGKKLRFLLR